MATQRLSWVDAAKGVGIILIVLGHSGIPKELEAYLFAFHVPLFFVLSGITFTVKEELSFREYAVLQARRLLWPYLLFAITSWLIRVLIYDGLLFQENRLQHFSVSAWEPYREGIWL